MSEKTLRVLAVLALILVVCLMVPSFICRDEISVTVARPLPMNQSPNGQPPWMVM